MRLFRQPHLFVCGGMLLPDRSALFVDGGYLSRVLDQEFGRRRIDFQALSQELASGTELFRTYYYNCLPYVSSPPTDEERTRYNRQYNFYTALERLSRYTVRLGRLEFRGLGQDGAPIFQQKRVDILLGVDLALLAAKRQIQTAILIAGDSDFIPAIRAAKDEGVAIVLVHGENRHHDLWQEADERFRIDQELIESVSLS